jgi:hypothetical protein
MFDPTLNPTVPQKLALQTRKGGVIANSMNPVEMTDAQSTIGLLKQRHPKAIHRDVGPSAFYNCHGLTFAARRTGISEPAQVQKIINDDAYVQLSLTNKPETGDIAIYRENGDISHSGIVVYVKAGTPWILGKWGDMHEVIHEPYDCPYRTAVITFYRLKK